MDIAFQARDSAAARAVREALAQNNTLEARDKFLLLPGVETHYSAWLGDMLGDVYIVGRVDLSAALAFLAALPHPKWVLVGCGVLHRAKKRFGLEKTPAVRLPAVALARLVHRLRGELDGSDRTQAETYWHEWFSPTVHAIVLGRPLVIEASAGHKVLYSASNDLANERDRRNVFLWRQQWTPKLVEKEQWLFVPVDSKWERFFIESVAFGEYLYAETDMKLPHAENNQARRAVRRRVFTWRNNSEWPQTDDARAHWQLIPVGDNDRNRGDFTLYNVATHSYLSPSSLVVDDDSRLMCVEAGNPTERVWRVLPQRLSAFDRGVAAFYGTRYADAAALFTQALSDDESNPMSTDEHTTCLLLRACCDLRLEEAVDHVLGDMVALEHLGGEQAARRVGLQEVWTECARSLDINMGPTKQIGAENEAISTTQRELMMCGDQHFVLRDVEKALVAYEKAAGVSAKTLQASNEHLFTQYADSQLRRVKCLYVLHRPEEALVVIDTLASWMEDTNKTVAVREGTHVELVLWRARCERKLQRYDQASSTLVRALDALASFSTSTSTPLSAWLEQSIRMEVEVIKIFEKELVDRLLLDHAKGEPTPESVDSTAEQLVHSLRCPLSFEFMRDPVLTPSGTTYERAVIEYHIDTVGTWDPMTRKELRKDQLYPNRALKVLLETMLSEPKLSTLVATCDP